MYTYRRILTRLYQTAIENIDANGEITHQEKKNHHLSHKDLQQTALENIDANGEIVHKDKLTICLMKTLYDTFTADGFCGK